MHIFVLDEMLSYKLESLLSPFLKVIHVSTKGLRNALDLDIWQLAKNNNFIIITKDSDFKALSNYHGCPPKVIRLNCGNQSTRFISELIKQNSEEIKDFAQSYENCYFEIG